MRDPVATLSSNGNRELPTDVTGILEDTVEAFLVSEIQNVNINSLII